MNVIFFAFTSRQIVYCFKPKKGLSNYDEISSMHKNVKQGKIQ